MRLFLLICFLPLIVCVKRVVLVGPTGSGKSTLVNRFLEKPEAKVSHTAKSCTRVCAMYSYAYEEEEIELIDTPGFPDTSSPEQGISNYNTILSIINKTKPDLILFLIRQGRWTREQENLANYAVIVKHFSNFGWYTVLSTSWGVVDVTDVAKEYIVWQQSMYKELHKIHAHTAAFGPSSECKREMKRVLDAKDTSIEPLPIPTVSSELLSIYHNIKKQVNESKVRNIMTQAKKKQGELSKSEQAFMLATLGTVFLPSLMPLGLGLFTSMGLGASFAAWTGFRAFEVYQDIGFFNASNNIIRSECTYVDTQLQQMRTQWRQNLSSYLSKLQEITGLKEPITLKSVHEILGVENILYLAQDMDALLNESCIQLIKKDSLVFLTEITQNK